MLQKLQVGEVMISPEVFHSPWRTVVGRLVSYWEGNFSEAMLNFGRVYFLPYGWIPDPQSQADEPLLCPCEPPSWTWSCLGPAKNEPSLRSCGWKIHQKSFPKFRWLSVQILGTQVFYSWLLTWRWSHWVNIGSNWTRLCLGYKSPT